MSTLRQFMCYLAACLALAALMFLAGLHGAHRAETALAVQCARNSDGTDSAIAECFERYSLPIPEDLQ